MKKITFNTVGIRTGANHFGDWYTIQYNIDLGNSEEAKFFYRDFRSAFDFEGREILIRPDFDSMKAFSIIDNGNIIGRIEGTRWNKSIPENIIMNNGETYKMKVIHEKFWKQIWNANNNQFELKSERETIKYTFESGASFEKWSNGQKYRHLKGQIESTNNNLLVSLAGLLFIELILIHEI